MAEGEGINRAQHIPPGDNVRIIDNQVWHVINIRNTLRGEVICVRCGDARRGCPVTGQIVNGVLHLSRRHSRHRHQRRDVQISQVRALRRQLFRASRFQLGKSVRQIYDDVTREYPDDIVHAVPFDSISGRMFALSANSRPPIPVDYLEMQRILEGPQWRELLMHDHGRIYMNCITAADGLTAAVYGDPAFAATIPEVEILDITMSGLVAPQVGNTQSMLMVTAMYAERALNFAWGLLNELSLDILRDIMEFIKRELVPSVNPRIIYTNFDWRFRNSIQAVWPEADVRPTFLHVCTAILQQVFLQPNIDLVNTEHLRIIKKLIFMLLIPSEAKPLMFLTIREALSRRNDGNTFQQLLEWYAAVFIHPQNRQLTDFFNQPALFSDICVAVSERIFARVEQNHEPNLWDFYRATMRILTANYEDLNTLINGNMNQIRNITRSPRVVTCIAGRLLRRLFAMAYSMAYSKCYLFSLEPRRRNPYASQCIQCQERSIEIMSRPCNCVCLCQQCETIIRENARRDGGMYPLECPNCHRRAHTFERVYIPPSNEPDYPFDWTCQVCADATISYMGQTCHHLFFCRQCVQRLQAQSGLPGGRLECPYCKQVGIMVEVQLRPQDN